MPDDELLTHARVLTITDRRASLVGRLFADLGATVTRVTRPGSTIEDDLDIWRGAGTTAVEVDLHAKGGHDALAGLLADHDVVVHNLGPVHGPAHGLDPVEVGERHARLVQVALADFGWSGPRAGWTLEPLPALAASGALHATGFPDRPPVTAPGFLAHDCASVYAVLSAVIGLWDRSRSGRGQWVDISVHEASQSGLNIWSILMADYLHVNPRLPAKGTRNADGSYWVLPAGDGWVRVVVGTPRQWAGFKHLLGRPDELEGPEWDTVGFRTANADVIRLVAADRLTDRTREQLVSEAETVGATIGSVHRLSEFVAHPQIRARQFFRFDHPAAPGLPFARAPWRIARGDASVAGPRRPASGELPLGGVRVVEFGVAAVVPEMCWVLSELGADVIKIESVVHPDVLRAATWPNLNQAFAFNAECRGRRSVALDLSTDEGQRLAFDLCARADVVAENNRGGVMDRLGLGYAAVAAANPGVVYAASQGYGRGGPLGEMPAYGPLNSSFAGVHLLWNDPDAPYPCGTSLNHPDHIAGKLLAALVVAALDRRRRDGHGSLIDLAQAETAAYLIGDMYLSAARTGADPEPVGNRSTTSAPHGVYPAAGDDRWLALSVPDDAAWTRFVAATGIAVRAGWESCEGRLVAEALDETVAAWTRERDADRATELLQAAGVSAMTVQGPDDHHADPHLAARKAIVETHHSEVGRERHVGNPMRFSSIVTRTAAAAPRLGEHTVEVLGEVLGLDAVAVEDLVARGVCR